jgi:hypothetical protein
MSAGIYCYVHRVEGKVGRHAADFSAYLPLHKYREDVILIAI